MIEIDFSKYAPEDQERLRTVQFGIDVERFVQSDIGRYLLGCAAMDKAQALLGLADVDAADANAVRELQMIIRRADSFKEWLEDAMTAGDNAEAELRGGAQ